MPFEQPLYKSKDGEPVYGKKPSPEELKRLAEENAQAEAKLIEKITIRKPDQPAELYDKNNLDWNEEDLKDKERGEIIEFPKKPKLDELEKKKAA